MQKRKYLTLTIVSNFYCIGHNKLFPTVLTQISTFMTYKVQSINL